ncbi:hypothetical protein X798_07691 [Onchocerca flexuosa]|uniref:Uncharacterized protein n=1 Tax=Onchocerca flexuosa TaxID=387005 RepID=A0A238BLD1_9BILA|nr:hypothetical protein X798_07691 [Onchocerca flexuosa]
MERTVEVYEVIAKLNIGTCKIATFTGNSKWMASKNTKNWIHELRVKHDTVMIVRYWAANLRLGADTAYSENIFRIGKRLITKLWNASKFVSIFMEKHQAVNINSVNFISDRSTVQADCLLSHLLLGTEYNGLPLILVRDLEEILLRECLALVGKSRKVVLLLMKALLISGLGMVISKGSYSTNQREHMIVRTMELVTKRSFSSLHGEKFLLHTSLSYSKC